MSLKLSRRGVRKSRWSSGSDLWFSARRRGFDPLTGRMVKSITQSDWDTEVKQHDTPVLVDFWASWCGPCKQVSPIVDQIASERNDIKFVKINIDENPELVAKLGITSVPTFALYNGSFLVDAFVGAKPRPWINSWLDDNVKG